MPWLTPIKNSQLYYYMQQFLTVIRHTSVLRDDHSTYRLYSKRSPFLCAVLLLLLSHLISGCFLRALAEPSPELLFLGLIDRSKSQPTAADSFIVSLPVPMNTSQIPILLAEEFDGSSWQTIPTATAQIIWLNSTQLQIKTGWITFPEFADLRFTVSNLFDTDSNPVADTITLMTIPSQGKASLLQGSNQGCYYYDTVSTNYVADAACAQTYVVGDPDFPYGQDGHYKGIRSNRDFTGPLAHAIWTNDYTTTDNRNGLIWKTCDEGKTGATCTGASTTYTWYQAVDACSALNTANGGNGYFGRTDWRLPTLQELKVLPDNGASPALEAGYFPNAQNAEHWTVTSRSTAAAYSVSYAVGGFLQTSLKAGALFAHCVAGSLVSPISFLDHGNGTITDQTTGLTWQKCSAGQTNDSTCSGAATTFIWDSALNYCETLTLAGHTDWRLPSASELKSLLNEKFTSPVIDPAYFPNTVANYYFTSTTSATSTNGAIYITFADGRTNANSKANNYRVRCVR